MDCHITLPELLVTRGVLPYSPPVIDESFAAVSIAGPLGFSGVNGHAMTIGSKVLDLCSRGLAL